MFLSAEAEIEQAALLLGLDEVDVGAGSIGTTHALPFVEDVDVADTSIDEGGGDAGGGPIEGFGEGEGGVGVGGDEGGEVVDEGEGSGTDVASSIDGERGEAEGGVTVELVLVLVALACLGGGGGGTRWAAEGRDDGNVNG